MKVVNYICNGNKYDVSGPFAKSLAYVLEALQNETPISQGYDYYVTSPYPNDALAYGHATCNPSLINSDCATCANYAKFYLIDDCDRGIGAQVELVDCSMRQVPDLQFPRSVLCLFLRRAPNLQLHHPILQAGSGLSILSSCSSGRLLTFNFHHPILQRASDLQFNHPVLQTGS
ncbi:hypothetical protein CQW23_08626 [Capsicum baccatum]|uniref:Gnk2-homologous domain-containing protein n=1 Tax=Capsicum baccatum TaxID=33114 RepID=A0A2G2X9H5_CAPBA|nr:hypothetical protein CQW23_08626 [Capsicum baccatum]